MPINQLLKADAKVDRHPWSTSTARGLIPHPRTVSIIPVRQNKGIEVRREGSGAHVRLSLMYPGYESGFTTCAQLRSSIGSSTALDGRKSRTGVRMG